MPPGWTKYSRWVFGEVPPWASLVRLADKIASSWRLISGRISPSRQPQRRERARGLAVNARIASSMMSPRSSLQASR
jgi:hypothetical protein